MPGIYTVYNDVVYDIGLLSTKRSGGCYNYKELLFHCT